MENQGREHIYKESIARIDPIKLALILPSWSYDEEVFVRGGKADQAYEERGWIFYPPGEYGFLKVEKDAKSVFFMCANNQARINGVNSVTARLNQSSSLIDFRSKNAHLFITFLPNEYKIEVRLDTGQKYPNTTRTNFEVTPQSRLRISAQTRLGDLRKFIG